MLNAQLLVLYSLNIELEINKAQSPKPNPKT